MSRQERSEPRRSSLSCPDVLQEEGVSPLSPYYRSFFEEECGAIAARLLADSAAAPGPSPDPADISMPWSPFADLVTSTPLESSSHPAAGSPSRSPFLGRSRGAPRRLVLPRASGRSRLQPPGVGRFLPGRLPARSSGRGAGRPSLALRASVGPKPREEPGAPASELPVPRGTKVKAMPAAKSRLPRLANRASQMALPSTRREAPHRNKTTEAASKAGGCRQPPQRLPTAIPAVASRARLQPAGKVASSKLTYLDKATQTWLCMESLYLSALHLGPSAGCGNAACAAQPAGCQWFRELEQVKKDLERAKAELAVKTAEHEAYCQKVSLQAQLRAAGVFLEDAEEDNRFWERN